MPGGHDTRVRRRRSSPVKTVWHQTRPIRKRTPTFEEAGASELSRGDSPGRWRPPSISEPIDARTTRASGGVREHRIELQRAGQLGARLAMHAEPRVGESQVVSVHRVCWRRANRVLQVRQRGAEQIPSDEHPSKRVADRRVVGRRQSGPRGQLQRPIEPLAARRVESGQTICRLHRTRVVNQQPLVARLGLGGPAQYLQEHGQGQLEVERAWTAHDRGLRTRMASSCRPWRVRTSASSRAASSCAGSIPSTVRASDSARAAWPAARATRAASIR